MKKIRAFQKIIISCRKAHAEFCIDKTTKLNYCGMIFLKPHFGPWPSLSAPEISK